MIPCAIERCRLGLGLALQSGHPILSQDSEGDLADSGGLFQAGDEGRAEFHDAFDQLSRK